MDYFALLCPDFYFQSRLTYSVNVLPVQDLSPGNIEEAEEAEPDDEFKDAIEVRKYLSIYLSIQNCFIGMTINDTILLKLSIHV